MQYFFYETPGCILNPCLAELLSFIAHSLEAGIATQFPASNDEKYFRE